MIMGVLACYSNLPVHQNHLFLLVATVQVLLTKQYHGIIRVFRNNNVLVMLTLTTSYKEEMKNMGESSL